MDNLNKYLDKVGATGTKARLEAIASMDLGKRSEAARRVLERRQRRLELMDMGYDIDTARVIVANENKL